MSTVTPFLNLVKAALLEQFSLSTLNNNLDLVDTEFARLKLRQATYTPVFGGIANKGTSYVESGSYVRVGKLVWASFYFKAGTASASLGTANVVVPLPFGISAANEAAAGGYAGLHSPGIGGLIYLLTPVLNPTANFAILYAMDSANKNALVSPGTRTLPFGNNDVFRGSVIYMTDDA